MSAHDVTRPGRPGPGPSRAYQFPRFERRVLPNGMGLVTATVSKLPLVTVTAVVDAGATRDPGNRAGMARLVAKLLLEGTERDDGGALIERFEQLGATIDADATWDGASVTMTVLRANLAPAFDLLSEVIRTPAFREREVDRLKAERHAELLQLRSEPRGLADESFSRFLYAPTSRYAHPEAGDPDSITAIRRDEVLAFHRAVYGPQRITMIMVGDVTDGIAEPLMAAAFGDWQGRVREDAENDDQQRDRSRQVRLVEKADAPQAELRIGHVGIPRGHPDYFAVVILNAILGGLFSSRINLNLREQHGYTYGAHSGFEWRRQAGPFMVSTAVQSEVTAKAANEVVSEIERIRLDPVTDEELTLATSYLEGVFPIQYETTASIATGLSTLVRHNLPNEYFNFYRDRIRSVSSVDVLRAAREHLHPDALQIVAVGDPAIIEPPMRELGFGVLRRYDAEWRLVST
jgi:zinc protease